MSEICFNGMYASVALGLLTQDEIIELCESGTMVTKQCGRCGKEKGLSEFFFSSVNVYSGASECKECSHKYQQTDIRKLSLKTNRSRRMSRKNKLPSTLTARQWREILTQYDHCCAYCGRSEEAVGTLHQEHVLPLSRGGGFTVLNIVPACHHCNSVKGSRTPDEAQLELKRIELQQMGMCL